MKFYTNILLFFILTTSILHLHGSGLGCGQEEPKDPFLMEAIKTMKLMLEPTHLDVIEKIQEYKECILGLESIESIDLNNFIENHETTKKLALAIEIRSRTVKIYDQRLTEFKKKLNQDYPDFEEDYKNLNLLAKNLSLSNTLYSETLQEMAVEYKITFQLKYLTAAIKHYDSTPSLLNLCIKSLKPITKDSEIYKLLNNHNLNLNHLRPEFEPQFTNIKKAEELNKMQEEDQRSKTTWKNFEKWEEQNIDEFPQKQKYSENISPEKIKETIIAINQDAYLNKLHLKGLALNNHRK